jgi:hypothetical protein
MEWLQIDRLASTQVELTGSTGNDTVDRAVLDALRSWRFRAAFYGISLPMASTDGSELTAKAGVVKIQDSLPRWSSGRCCTSYGPAA